MDWGQDGSFMSRPKQGWLHAVQQLQPDAGVRYVVKYIGSITVLESMRVLDIDTRTAVTNESINRISSTFNPGRGLRKNHKLDRYLGTDMRLCGVEVNLTIDTDSLSVVDCDTGDLLFQHHMPTISFASGGEPPSQDLVAYVAKSDDGTRLSHVFECRSGLARDVITTIGQVFEIRFKTYLSQKGGASNHPIPDCVPTPPLPAPQEPPPPPPPQSSHEVQYYNQQHSPPLSELPHNMFPPPLPPPVNNDHNGLTNGGKAPICTFCHHVSQPSHHHCHHHHHSESPMDPCIPSHTSPNHAAFARRNSDRNHHMCSPTSLSSMHDRSIESFHNTPDTIMNSTALSSSRSSLSPYNEIWFHGKITRPKAEELLQRPGDFLVRESPNSPGQFVLSGRQGSSSKHLLLVDPEGKVRTKDQLFNSVSHLVNYHLYNQIPIISNDSQLLLINPIHCTTIHN